MNEAYKIIKMLDSILDAEELYHGPNCRRIEGTNYFHNPCKCGLGKLESLQLELVEAWLEKHKDDM
jgi:hypothetical protein